MTTAVLDIDLQQLPAAVGNLEHVDEALILFRLAGRPIGQTWLRPQHGQISGAELRSRLLDAAGWSLGRAWIDQYLAMPAAVAARSPRTSIAICLQYQSTNLRACLSSLAGLPDDGQEILVIDRAPGNRRNREAAEFAGVGYVCADGPGLAAVRNQALTLASHELVAFIDDRAQVDPQWLRAATRNFADPLVACVTGLVMPQELTTAAQEIWEHYFAPRREFDRRSIDAGAQHFLQAATAGAGSNMCIRRSMRFRVGPLSEALGAGTPARAGDDDNWLSDVLASGFRIIYEPAALTWQHYPRTKAELLSAAHTQGSGIAARLTHQLLARREASALAVWWRTLASYAMQSRPAAPFRRQDRLVSAAMNARLIGFLRGPQCYLAARRRLRHIGGAL